MSGGRGSRRHRTTPPVYLRARRDGLPGGRRRTSIVVHRRRARCRRRLLVTVRRQRHLFFAGAWCTTWMNESGSPKRSASSCATRAAVVAPAEPSMPPTTAAVMPEILPCFRIRSASPCRRRFATGAPPYRRAVATSFARRGRTLRCRLGLDQTAPDRVASQLDAIGHAQFVEDVRAVALDRLDADEKLLRDLL